MRGMKANFPEWSPVRIRVSITRSVKRTTRSREPLQRPSRGARLRNRIIGHPGLSSNLYGGKPESLKTQLGMYCFCPPHSSKTALSALK